MEEINIKSEKGRVIDVIGIDMSENIESDKDKRENEKCYTCNTVIKRMVIGGRSTYYCENCQK